MSLNPKPVGEKDEIEDAPFHQSTTRLLRRGRYCLCDPSAWPPAVAVGGVRYTPNPPPLSDIDFPEFELRISRFMIFGFSSRRGSRYDSLGLRCFLSMLVISLIPTAEPLQRSYVQVRANIDDPKPVAVVGDLLPNARRRPKP